MTPNIESNSQRKAKIYKPSKSAMQSGIVNTNFWVLEFIEKNNRYQEPLMGWTGSHDTNTQLVLHFNSLNEAEKYAKKENIEYIIIKNNEHSIHAKSYSTNFISRPSTKQNK